MYHREYLSGVVITAACIAVLCEQPAEAANIRVTNVAMAGDGNVQFDITWDDSWRASWTECGVRWANWDAAWIFVKYRKKGDPGWSHAALSTRDADHSALAGAEIHVGSTGTRGMGVFLYRSAEGKGTWANKGVRLKWLYKEDGVTDPGKFELFVHALEMVYVPRGGFYVGSGGKLAGSFTEGSWRKGNDVIPFKVISEKELKVAPEPGCLYGTAGPGAAHQMGHTGKLPAEFPKGYGAFYCMKYEINQGEYAAFLDQLTEQQATARYPRRSITPRFIKTTIQTITKAPSGYTATEPERTCNWVSWDDCTAYNDWAGLRPMTELEFEKACRGPLRPVENEYAWGTGKLEDTKLPTLAELPEPPYPVGICGKDGRVKSGCSYWGVAALSGHVRERTVAVGHKEGWAFTRLCGDGAIAADGLSNVPGWPGPEKIWPKPGSYVTAGAGFRGGPWYKDIVRLRVSDRFLSSCLRKSRDRSYGFRGVRQAP